MLVRKLAVASVALVVLFGATACSFSREVASKAVYAPSDGNQTDAGTLHARNVLILSDGTNAFLIGSITNDGKIPAVATLSILDGATATPVGFRISNGLKVDFGYPEALGFVGSKPGIKLEGALPKIGSNVEVKLDGSIHGTTSIGSGTMAVQVIDASLPTYAGFLDDLVSSALVTVTPTITESPAPSATPTP
jgi:hypothetical protein